MHENLSIGSPGAPLVSIVVPTSDRPHSLQRCLAALRRQRQPGGSPTPDAARTEPAPFEILVVDDQSRDAAAVRQVVDAVAQARLVLGSGRGPAAARNAGAAEARAEIVCFTDDDCEPEPAWASALAGAIGRGADAAGGRTINAEPSDRLAEASQHIANYLGEHSRRGDVPFAASNNLACRTALVREIRFDESYPLAAGEDRAWCEELAARGYKLGYESTALVRHRQKLTSRSFWAQHARYGRGAYRFGRDRGGALPSPVTLYPQLVGSGFRFGPGVGALVGVAQAATAAGYVRAAIAARRAR